MVLMSATYLKRSWVSESPDRKSDAGDWQAEQRKEHQNPHVAAWLELVADENLEK